MGDIRKMMDKKPKPVEAPPPEPDPPKAIEYPVYKDPPLEAVSPGNGKLDSPSPWARPSQGNRVPCIQGPSSGGCQSGQW